MLMCVEWTLSKLTTFSCLIIVICFHYLINVHYFYFYLFCHWIFFNIGLDLFVVFIVCISCGRVMLELLGTCAEWTLSKLTTFSCLIIVILFAYITICRVLIVWGCFCFFWCLYCWCFVWSFVAYYLHLYLWITWF